MSSDVDIKYRYHVKSSCLKTRCTPAWFLLFIWNIKKYVLLESTDLLKKRKLVLIASPYFLWITYFTCSTYACSELSKNIKTKKKKFQFSMGIYIISLLGKYSIKFCKAEELGCMNAYEHLSHM